MNDTPTPEQVFDTAPPLTGGNSYGVNQRLIAQTQFNLSTIPTAEIIKTTANSTFKDAKYVLWYLMNFQGDYFCNRWVYRTANARINRLIKLTIRDAFFYGISGMYKDIDGVIKRVSIILLNKNSGGQVVSAKVAYINDYDGQSVMSDKRSFDDGDIFTIPTKLIDNLAILYWNDICTGAWVLIRPFVLQQERMLSIINSSAYTYLKKFVYEVKDATTVSTEMDAFYNADTPFLTALVGPNGLLSNKFTQINLGNLDAENLKTYYNFFVETYYKILGRRTNDTKKDKGERNLTDEVAASQYNYEVLENETYFYIVDFIKHLSTLIPYEIKEYKAGRDYDN